jgi:hypothetical protein
VALSAENCEEDRVNECWILFIMGVTGRCSRQEQDGMMVSLRWIRMVGIFISPTNDNYGLDDIFFKNLAMIFMKDWDVILNK